MLHFLFAGFFFTFGAAGALWTIGYLVNHRERRAHRRAMALLYPSPPRQTHREEWQAYAARHVPPCPVTPDQPKPHRPWWEWPSLVGIASLPLLIQAIF